MVLNHAILLQPCKHLLSIELVEDDSDGLDDDSDDNSGAGIYYPGIYYPTSRYCQGPPLLLKGHLPSLEKLEVGYDDDPSVVAEATRAGHLTRVKELHIESCNGKPLQLRTLLEAPDDMGIRYRRGGLDRRCPSRSRHIFPV